MRKVYIFYYNFEGRHKAKANKTNEMRLCIGPTSISHILSLSEPWEQKRSKLQTVHRETNRKPKDKEIRIKKKKKWFVDFRRSTQPREIQKRILDSDTKLLIGYIVLPSWKMICRKNTENNEAKESTEHNIEMSLKKKNNNKGLNWS